MRKGCVSVIVPVFNQEQYIEVCLNSIMSQSYHDVQIIVVDDGSTDSTGSIVDKLSEQDKRIEVFHIENGGVSSARNFALEKVKGEYIQFVDADDIILKNMTKTLVKTMEGKQADMVVCNYVKKFSKVYILNDIIDKPTVYSAEDYLINTLKDPGHHYYGVVWNKLYKTEIIKKNCLFFDKLVTLGEDFIFNISYWKCCKKVAVVFKYLYIYNKMENSTLSNKRFKRISDCINELKNRKKIFEAYRNCFVKRADYEDLKDKIYRYWIVFYVRQSQGLNKEYYSWSQTDKDKWIEIINEEELIKDSFGLVPEKWIKKYMRNYAISLEIKNRIKKVFKI